MGIKYIFRWKEDRIEVRPTKSDSRDGAWQKAFRGIYPAGLTPEQGKAYCQKYGEVVEVSE